MIQGEDLEIAERVVQNETNGVEDLREAHRKISELIGAEFDALNNYCIHLVGLVSRQTRLDKAQQFFVGFAVRQAFAVGVLVGKATKEEDN